MADVLVVVAGVPAKAAVINASVPLLESAVVERVTLIASFQRQVAQLLAYVPPPRTSVSVLPETTLISHRSQRRPQPGTRS